MLGVLVQKHAKHGYFSLFMRNNAYRNREQNFRSRKYIIFT